MENGRLSTEWRFVRMCENRMSNCRNKSKYWVQRDSANLLVCGRCLPRTVIGFWEMPPSPVSHPSYKIQHGSSVVVKMRTKSGGYR